MREILATGSTGFTGSAVCRHFANDAETNVINVDTLTCAGDRASMRPIENQATYRACQADGCDEATIGVASEVA